MAVVKWQGGAEAVAQVDTVQVLTYAASTVYRLTVGNVDLDVDGDTDVNTTATAIAGAWNASTHPYFTGVTASAATDTVTLTADTPGMPFTASSSIASGTGTIGSVTSSTACTGPHHFDNAANFVGGALPVASDDLVVANGYSILYGLDALSAVTLDSFTVHQSFRGAVGLEPAAFATTLDGQTFDDNLVEYRTAYVDIDAPLAELGVNEAAGEPGGAARVCLDMTSTVASNTVVHNTAQTVTVGRPAVRWKAGDADADLEIRYAPGGVGVGTVPGETFTVGELLVSDETSVSQVDVGSGITLTSFECLGGQSRVRAAADISSVICRGGDLRIAGEGYKITTLDVKGGTCTDEHRASSGVSWTTVSVDSGTLAVPAVQGAARTVTTVNHRRGTIEGDLSRFSVTTWGHTPAAGQKAQTRLTAVDA